MHQWLKAYLEEFLTEPVPLFSLPAAFASNPSTNMFRSRTIAIGSVLAVASASSVDKTKMFKDFMHKFDKKYTDEEKELRFKIFSDNVDVIHASNAQNKSYTLGITTNADKTAEEFKAQYFTGLKMPLTAVRDGPKFTAPEGFEAPESVDWVKKGAVTSVKNQGSCGSCWAFSAAGGLEGAMAAAGRPLVDLSEQNIIACDKGGNGCGGGDLNQAFDFVAQNGLQSLKDDPYLCVDGQSSQCKNMQCDAGCQTRTGDTCTLHGEAFCQLRVPGSKCDKAGWIHHCVCPAGQCFENGKCSSNHKQPTQVLKPGDVVKHTDVDRTESALEAAVAQQPVSVAIEADQAVFQHYTGGVLTDDACGSQLDHGVLVVGYGVLDGKKYWRLKNSWGPSWGDNGYINIERGSASDGGECGIRKMAVFPSIKAADTVVV